MRISRKQKKIIFITLAVLLLIIGGGLVYGLSHRAVYLDKAVVKAKKKLKEDYQLNFDVANYRFSGLATVVFDNVVVVPEERDTLAAIQKLAVSVRIWPLLFGDVRLGDLDIVNGKISFVRKDTLSNYDFLFKKSKGDSISVEKPSEQNFAEWTEKLADRAFAFIPEDAHIENMEVSYRDTSTFQQVQIPEAHLDGGDFESRIILNETDAEWLVSGVINGRKKRVKVEVASRDKKTELPFLRRKFGLGVSFDKVVFDLERIAKKERDLLTVSGSFLYDNLVVNHRRLSDKDIMLPQGEISGGIDIAADFVKLSENITIKVRDFELKPQLKLTIKPEKKIELAIHTGKFVAQHFFDAIPAGLFETLDGVQVKGNIQYDLDFSVVLDRPDAIVFSSSIDDRDLQVVKWGNAHIDSLNYPFEYDAYDDTILLRRIVVGTENPHFIPLADIPYVLKATVRNTEDPFFYKHNGFEEEAFKLSIVTNLKEKQFKRGASTISMQLIKNVFLHRKKTMNRKFEEIILVWLMEASGQVPKDRIFEIYLNVIEWGKNVYGIAEAANYYFGKDARELGLGESLFLSSIIPRPKTGLSSFDYTGYLKPWVKRHFNTYGYIMDKVGDLKNVQVPESYGFYDVVLQPRLRPSGPAMMDTTSIDGIIPEHEEMMRELEREDEQRKSVVDRLLDREKIDEKKH